MKQSLIVVDGSSLHSFGGLVEPVLVDEGVGENENVIEFSQFFKFMVGIESVGSLQGKHLLMEKCIDDILHSTGNNHKRNIVCFHLLEKIEDAISTGHSACFEHLLEVLLG